MQPAHRHQIERDTGNPAVPADSPPDMARRAALGQFDADVLAWVADAFRRVVGGEAIEAAFRLDRASRFRVRDDALRRAADLLALGTDDAWPVAGRLAQAVARHQRMRGAPETPLEHALAAAFSAGVPVPKTQRMLYAIIH